MSTTPPPSPEATSAPPRAPSPAELTPGRILGLFLLGIPALVAVAALIAFLFWQSRQPLIDHYEGRVEQALAAGDDAAALVALERLGTLDPTRVEYRLQLVGVLDRMGNPNRAEALLRTLAPLDGRPGYTPAHLWLAQRAMAMGRFTGRAARDAESHLKIYLESEPDDAAARILLGSLYALGGRFRDARALIEPYAPNNPALLYDLAKIDRSLGDLEAARRHANESRAITYPIVQNQPVNLVARILCSNASAIMGQYDEAIALLEAGRNTGNNAAIQRAKSDVCITWDEDLAATGKTPISQRYEVLDRGYGFDPTNEPLINRLSQLVTSNGPEADLVRKRLQNLIRDGRSPGLAHFALGNDAFNRNRGEDARRHWEDAIRQAPRLTLAANNLAWALAFQAPRDLPRALDLAERAVAQAPNDPRIRATRGQVLALLGRDRDALPDLETATSSPLAPPDPDVRESLAHVYDRLGQPEKAQTQRRLAKPAGP